MKHIYLDLSTGHLTEETINLLKVSDICRLSGWPAMTIATYEYGVFLTVPEYAEQEQWDALPKDLLAVIDYAVDPKREANITLLRFDSDGDNLEGLPNYEWEAP